MEYSFTNRHQNEIGRSPVHIYLAPHPLLRPYIAHYTLTHPNFEAQMPSRLALVPDASGCFIFTLDNKLSSILYGATTRVVVVEILTRRRCGCLWNSSQAGSPGL